MTHYFAVGKTDDGKFMLFDKFTDDRRAFFYELRREYDVEVLCIFSEGEYLGEIHLE